MLRLRLALDKLRPHNIAHAISHEDSCSHGALLCCTCDIRHADNDGLTDDRAECTDDQVACNRRGGVVSPLALPDHSAACDNRKAVYNEQNDADIRDLAREVAAEQDDNKTQRAKGKLPQNRLESRPAEGADNQGAEAGDGAVDCIGRCHENEDEPELEVEESLSELGNFDLLAAHAGLPLTETLDGDDTLGGREEPGRGGRIWDEEAPDTEEEGEAACKEVDILPPTKGTGGDLGESVVKGATDDGEKTSRCEPPRLSQCLLVLRVVSTDDTHKASRNNALDEAQEESLCKQSLVRGDGCSQHTDAGPENDHTAKDPSDVEPLQSKSHGIQPSQHAKIEHRSRPAKALSVGCGRRGLGVHNCQGKILGHTKKNSRTKNGLVVVYQAIA